MAGQRERVKVSVRPGEAVRFPAICINCGQAATKSRRLSQRQGRVTRLVDVPICADCTAALQRLSGDEERWRRLAWLAAGLVAILVFALSMVLGPSLFLAARLLLSLLLALMLALVVLLALRRHGLTYARPEKRAILEAARLIAFSWRTTTFEFSNAQFVERFRFLNEPELMET